MSHSFLRRLLIASLISALASLALGQSNRGYVRLKRIGPLVKVEDNVSKEITREYAEQPAEEVRILENNTVITTGEGSSVILVFSNGATINVKADSVLNIKTFRQDPFAGSYDPSTATDEPAATSRTEIFLERGELVGNVKKLNPKSTFNVATPAGAAGIRGTTFRVVFRPTGTGQAFFSVTTLEGDVGVTTADGTVAVPIGVLDGQEIEILVDVDDTTGVVTVSTPVAQIATATADPVVLASINEAVQQTAQAVVNVVISSNTDQAPTTGEGDAGNASDDPGNGSEAEDESTAEGPPEAPQPPSDSATPPVIDNGKPESPKQGEG